MTHGTTQQGDGLAEESGPGARAEEPWCAVCGRGPQDDADRLGWSYGSERGRAVWTCTSCARRHARSIEGKLDSEWW